MIPTLTNTPIATTLFIIFLCIVGMYLTIQLDKAKKKVNNLSTQLVIQSGENYSKHLELLAKKTEVAIIKDKLLSLNIDRVTEQIAAAKYGYQYHAATRFKLMNFEKNCLNNFLQHLEAKQLKNES